MMPQLSIMRAIQQREPKRLGQATGHIKVDPLHRCLAARAFSSEVEPVRVKKTRQIENLEPRFNSIETEKALVTVKPVKQRFCLANVGDLKALRECPVHRFKDLPCVGIPVLPDPETRKA
jgi:hypothetical protein